MSSMYRSKASGDTVNALQRSEKSFRGRNMDEENDLCELRIRGIKLMGSWEYLRRMASAKFSLAFMDKLEYVAHGENWIKSDSNIS